MNAKELRIGNIIQSTEFKNPFSVDYQNIGFVMLEPDKYEPVKLTPEWLERFGFELDYESRYRKEYVLIAKDMAFTFCFSKHKNEDNWFSVMGLIPDLNLFQHVHQLQNLYFALTGEELV